MVGKNNKQVMNEKNASKAKRYALKKLNVGVASVAVGTLLFMGTGANIVSAEEATAEEPAAAETVPAPENGGGDAQKAKAPATGLDKEVVSIDFNTTFVENPNLPEGHKHTVQKGSKGEKEIVYYLAYGKRTGIHSETVTKEAVNTVIEVGTGKVELKEEAIEFETEYRDNPHMPKGETKVLQPGKNGVATVEYLNGKRIATSYKVVQQPVNQIVERGTAVVETKEEVIEFDTEYRDNPNLPKGQTKVVQAGKNGLATVDYYNGKRVATSYKVVQEAVTEVIERGTKEAATGLDKEVVEIEFETEYRDNADLLEGEERVIQEGVNGEKEVVYYLTYGERTGVHSENVLKEPVKQVIERGTKKPATGLETVTEDIEFETEYRDNPELKEGETRVIQEGKNGKKEVVYYLTYGERTGVHSEKVLEEAVNKIVERGTKKAIVGSANVIVKDEKGTPAFPVKVSLLDVNSGKVVATAETKDGVARFENLAEGTYLARVQGLKGYRATDPAVTINDFQQEANSLIELEEITGKVTAKVDLPKGERGRVNVGLIHAHTGDLLATARTNYRGFVTFEKVSLGEYILAVQNGKIYGFDSTTPRVKVTEDNLETEVAEIEYEEITGTVNVQVDLNRQKRDDVVVGLIHEYTGELLQTAKTNRGGWVKFEGVSLGSYVIAVQEDDVYGWDPVDITVELNEDNLDTTAKVDYEEVKGVVKVQVDLNKEKRSGVVVGLIDAYSGSLLQEITTNRKGWAIFEEVTLGSYVLAVQNDDVYGWDAKNVQVDLSDDKREVHAELVYEEITGKVKVHVDLPEGEKGSVKVGLIDAQSGKLLEVSETNKDGDAYFDSISLGDYVVAIQDGEFYGFDSTTSTVELDEDNLKVKTTIEYNEITGTVDVKVEFPDGKEKTVTVGLIDAQTGKLLETADTNDKGRVRFENVSLGSYVVALQDSEIDGYDSTTDEVALDEDDLKERAKITFDKLPEEEKPEEEKPEEEKPVEEKPEEEKPEEEKPEEEKPEEEKPEEEKPEAPAKEDEPAAPAEDEEPVAPVEDEEEPAEEEDEEEAAVAEVIAAEGERLPDTATGMWGVGLAGLVSLVGGAGASLFNKKKKK